MTFNVGDRVMLQEQPKFKLDRTYQGPYRVYEVTDTNAKIKPVTEPDGETRCVSLQKISKCIPPDEVWLGHNKAKSTRTFKKGEEDEKNVLELCNNKQ